MKIKQFLISMFTVITFSTVYGSLKPEETEEHLRLLRLLVQQNRQEQSIHNLPHSKENPSEKEVMQALLQIMYASDSSLAYTKNTKLIIHPTHTTAHL